MFRVFENVNDKSVPLAICLKENITKISGYELTFDENRIWYNSDMTLEYLWTLARTKRTWMMDYVNLVYDENACGKVITVPIQDGIDSNIISEHAAKYIFEKIEKNKFGNSKLDKAIEKALSDGIITGDMHSAYKYGGENYALTISKNEVFIRRDNTTQNIYIENDCVKCSSKYIPKDWPEDYEKKYLTLRKGAIELTYCIKEIKQDFMLIEFEN